MVHFYGFCFVCKRNKGFYLPFYRYLVLLKNTLVFESILGSMGDNFHACILHSVCFLLQKWIVEFALV